jgi:preprotein translocase subunit Sec63
MKLLFLKPNPEKGIPDGKYLTTFWNHKGIEQESTYIDKGDTVSCLIKPQMLWVANRTFGITWVCTQVRVTKQVKVSGYAFKQTEDFNETDELNESSEFNEELNTSEEEVEEVEVDEDSD